MADTDFDELDDLLAGKPQQGDQEHGSSNAAGAGNVVIVSEDTVGFPTQPEEGDYVLIGQFHSRVYANILISKLHASSVMVFAQNLNEFAMVEQGFASGMSTAFGNPLGTVRLWVHVDDLDAANNVLKTTNFEGAEALRGPDAAPPVGLPECPACGALNPLRNAECGTCGLWLA
jgi:hypothetical protein